MKRTKLNIKLRHRFWFPLSYIKPEEGKRLDIALSLFLFVLTGKTKIGEGSFDLRDY